MASTKAKIIAAAASVAREQGVQHMTMDAVAEEASLSKGGVFYHFKSKHDLLVGMVQALVDVTDETVSKSRETDDAAGSWLRGFIKASLAEDVDGVGSVGALSIAFLTAAATDTRLLQPMIERQETWREAINTDGLDPVTAQIIRLAADGLWINDTMGVPVLTEAERSAVVARLREMTTGTDSPA